MKTVDHCERKSKIHGNIFGFETLENSRVNRADRKIRRVATSEVSIVVSILRSQEDKSLQ